MKFITSLPHLTAPAPWLRFPFLVMTSHPGIIIHSFYPLSSPLECKSDPAPPLLQSALELLVCVTNFRHWPTVHPYNLALPCVSNAIARLLSTRLFPPAWLPVCPPARNYTYMIFPDFGLGGVVCPWDPHTPLMFAFITGCSVGDW